jgi:hypothetical protein
MRGGEFRHFAPSNSVHDLCRKKPERYKCGMSQTVQIFAALEKNGWLIEVDEVESEVWWAHGAWKLKSIWSPKNSTIHLMTLIDPGFEGDLGLLQAEDIWAIGLSKKRAVSRLDPDLHSVGLGRKLGPRIEEILSIANELRMV